MLNSYREHAKERDALGIPPLPLNPEQTAELCRHLESPPEDTRVFLLNLLSNRIPPGVDAASKVKADWLREIAFGRLTSPLVSPRYAIQFLGHMLGGYNIQPLIELLDHPDLASDAAEALSRLTLVYTAFDDIVTLSRTNRHAQAVLKGWADAWWFTEKPSFPDILTLKVYKVDGEINTDDFSPAGHAFTRADIPLHALSMGEKLFPDGIETIRKFRQNGFQVAFVGDVVGTGSSRKSACNSLMWHIGDDIPFVPNKRRGGVVIGGLIAPIFFNTTQDSGGLPIMCPVDNLHTGDEITLDFAAGRITDNRNTSLAEFQLKPHTLQDEYRAGGRLSLIIGKDLTARAREALGLAPTDLFIPADNPEPAPDQSYTLGQKIVGKACGRDGILPGTACEPEMATVGSQDTTGPMTVDELKELACLEFQCGLFMQSFCHTAAYPKPSDIRMHRELPGFITDRKGVSLHPGDGVIHSWLNRLLLPDTVGTGGDSHTRFPIGISFPAGSGLVAFAGALGFMPLDMPESVLVRFHGNLNPGITLRDVVNAIPYTAIQQGLLTVSKQNKQNIFNGRILEMEGLPDLTVEQAFELTDASAERSAAASTIQLTESAVQRYLESNIRFMEYLIEAGFAHAETLQSRIHACRSWLDNPVLLKRDSDADYAAIVDIDLSAITEPILACPNDPDDVKPLSELVGTPIDELFIGSCMTNIGHFRAAAKIWKDQNQAPVRIWITPPTRMDEQILKSEGTYNIFASIGARTEIPGCSLCMGNQARVRPEATVYSTSTRNFDNRMGDGAQVYLGSAELGAVAALIGKLPTPDEYLTVIRERILPEQDQIYRYLEFDRMATSPVVR